MIPRHSTLRAALFAGVSTLALSIGAAELRAADLTPQPRAVLKTPAPFVAPPAVTMWIEGAAIWTGGSAINGLGPTFFTSSGAPASSFTTGNANIPFKPKVGWEAAAGLDWRLAGSPWHISFDVRGGLSNSNSRKFHNEFTNSAFGTCPPPGSGNCSQFVRTDLKASAHESHLVADFMIGREFGLGLGLNQVKIGVRVADLRATVRETGAFFTSVFQVTEGGSHNTIRSGAGALDITLRSRFLGVGPRIAVEGAMPVAPRWSVDYNGGVAVLFGDQTLNANVTAAGCAGGSCAFFFNAQFTNKSSNAVFNADGSVALSYLLTPGLKGSVGVRADFYDGALRTLNFNTGTFHNENRTYWGPFLRLTGAF